MAENWICAFHAATGLRDKEKIELMGSGTLEVLVDSGTSRDNVTRLAESKGWNVSIKEQDDEFTLTLSK